MLQTLVSNTPVRPSDFSSAQLPKAARVVIVGGGVVGCSLAYHLAKLGWKEVLLLEQCTIGGGTTWHAAGMVGQLRTNNSLTKINKYSVELYRDLQAETGHDLGWLEVGSLILGTSAERMTQLRRTAAMAGVFGVEAHLLGPEEARAKWPLIRHDDVLGAVWLPKDGRVIPGETAVALAKGAAQHGAQIVQQVRVEEVKMRQCRAVGVKTSQGEVAAEWVVLCGGMWTRQLGLAIGIDIPLYPVEHHYILSEPIAGASRDFPCGRDPNEMIYFRTLDDGSIMVGAFQHRSQPWMVERVPSSFSCALLEEDWPRFTQPLAAAKHRIPALETAAFPKFVNGPESFTPDNNFIMGEPAGTRGLFVLAGFNSVGIASAGGAGKYAAEWLDAGRPTMDLWSVDIRRFAPFQNDRAYLRERTSEVLGLHYQMAWPNREMETARGLRHTALYDQLKARGACFGSVMGWERANWFAPPGVEPRTQYSFGRQNWLPYVSEEVLACRRNVALFDQSTFSKYLLRGRDALAVLQHLCANQIDVPIGRVVYTAMLTERGTFASDLTVVRLADEEFYLITGSAQTLRDADWIGRHTPPGAEVDLLDVTAAFGVIGIMGPQARALLAQATEADLSNGAFPFGTAKEIDLAGTRIRAVRITYVGELGWELHVPWANMMPVYHALMELGEPLGLRHAGNTAIGIMRTEKAYRAWGHDISEDETPLEAGLGFAVAWDKKFLGQPALAAQKQQGIRKRLVALVLDDPEPVLWGSEPILGNGQIVGYTTSGCWSPTLGRAIALGYVRLPDGGVIRPADLRQLDFAVVNDGQSYAAKLHLDAPYDPQRARILG